MNNALLVHGGAPTAVINASLYGAVTEAKKHAKIGKIYASIGGSGGILRQNFLDMKTLPQEKLDLLLQTPASAIGTSREHLEPEDYDEIARVIKQNGIRYVFFNGGNGSMNTCGKVYEACQKAGVNVQVLGIPKTIDNDIAVTDHTPGYGSAARYIAGTVSEICQDVRALPIHICIVETMGRNAGWITAASSLAQLHSGDGPDLIYTPERPFSEEQFLEDALAQHRQKGGVVVVVSEGLKKENGDLLLDPIFEMDGDAYYGDISAYLATMVIKRLGIKARSEKPGICGRSSISFQSGLDRDEAVLAGAEAVRAAVSGHTGVMVGFARQPDSAYVTTPILIPIERVMKEERLMPKHFINAAGNGIDASFAEWCRPLLGGPLREFVSFRCGQAGTL